MEIESTVSRMASLLRRLRQDRRISQLQLADEAGVDASVVNRAERGENAKLATWEKLFEGLGYRLLIEVTELSEESEELMIEEAARRRENRRLGLCGYKVASPRR